MDGYISPGIIAGMLLEFLITAGLPILLLAVWHTKTNASLIPALGGAAVFFLIVKILEPVVHYFCLGIDSPVSRAITGSAWSYALYAGMAAGIFEETGRLLCFIILKRYRGRQTAVTYGIGHGGFESISLVSISMIFYITIAISIDLAGGTEAYMARQAGAQAAAVSQIVASVTAMSGPGIFWGTFERVVALFLQIALSVFVFAAVAGEGGRRLLFPAAILLHAAADITPAMYQYGKIKSLASVELPIAVYTLVVGFLAYFIYRNMKIPVLKKRKAGPAENAGKAGGTWGKEAHTDSALNHEQGEKDKNESN